MLIETIWPLFALICLGFALARSGFPSPEFWHAADQANYFIFFPALLFASLADAPVRDPAVLRLGGAVAATLCIGAGALAVLRRARPSPASRFGASLQGVLRFNTYLALAIVASLAGEAGLGRGAVLLAVAVPLVNVLSILALTEGKGAGPAAILRPILRNPLILACALGLATALSGFELPFGAPRLFDLLAQASLPLGLLCVGAALRPDAMRRELAPLAGVSALRLVGMPVLAALVGGLFALNATEVMVLVVFAAVPTAPTSYALTRQMGGDAIYMAGIVTLQTLLSVMTIPLILAFLGFA